MKIEVVSLFPPLVAAVAECGVTGRAVDKGLMSLGFVNPREYTADVHRTVDDRPYGGGPGMVMKYEPLAKATAVAKARLPEGSPVVALGPQGRVFDQAAARRLARLPGLVLVAGRYEGIDERFLEAVVDCELSLGDFVLSGGEIAAMAVIDAVARLLPGALGHEASAAEDSFAGGLLEGPQYTRPEVIEGRAVPEVLLSGDHGKIARWRLKQALGRSYSRRPDLLDKLELTDGQRRLLEEYLQERNEAFPATRTGERPAGRDK